jgi:SAM-dependent methyltransferase
MDIDQIMSKIRERVARPPGFAGPVAAEAAFPPDEAGHGWAGAVLPAVLEVLKLLADRQAATRDEIDTLRGRVDAESRSREAFVKQLETRVAELDAACHGPDGLGEVASRLARLYGRLDALEDDDRLLEAHAAVSRLGEELARLSDRASAISSEVRRLSGEVGVASTQAGHAARSAARVESCMADGLAELRRSQEDLKRGDGEARERARELASRVDRLAEDISDLRRRTEAPPACEAVARQLTADLAGLVRREALPEARPVHRAAEARGECHRGGEVPGASARENPMPAFDYLLFEQNYRGPIEEIKGRQRSYLEWFAGAGRVIDLGCGRGEFVELLAENGVSSVGVEKDPAMVGFCRGRNLNVVRSDLFAFLSAQPGASVDGIFSAQVVEHMAAKKIIRLTGLCERVLAPGGLLVIETINPDCDLGMRNFFLDPTHVRPAPARMLKFILEQGHYRVECLLFSSPCPDAGVAPQLQVREGWPDDVRLYQDYAVIARRA